MGGRSPLGGVGETERADRWDNWQWMQLNSGELRTVFFSRAARLLVGNGNVDGASGNC